MSTTLNPYLNFRSTARAAMEFYQRVFGGDLTVSTFAEFQVSEDPAEADFLMHSQLTTAGGLVLMAADVPSVMQLANESNVSISLSGTDEAELRGYWEALSEGATVINELEKAPWGDSFGMLNDQFGTSWLVNISGAPA